MTIEDIGPAEVALQYDIKFLPDESDKEIITFKIGKNKFTFFFITEVKEVEDVVKRIKTIADEEERDTGKVRIAWEKISGYPRQGDYIRASWQGKNYEGEVLGDKAVAFRTGFVARRIKSYNGREIWIPWTLKANFERRRIIMRV